MQWWNRALTWQKRQSSLFISKLFFISRKQNPTFAICVKELKGNPCMLNIWIIPRSLFPEILFASLIKIDNEIWEAENICKTKRFRFTNELQILSHWCFYGLHFMKSALILIELLRSQWFFWGEIEGFASNFIIKSFLISKKAWNNFVG